VAPFFVVFLAIFVFLGLFPGPEALADESGQSGAGQETASASVPQQPAEVFLYDGANLLSEDTKAAVRQKNADLQGKYGVQIAVYTADMLPYSEFAQRVEFLRSVMGQWQIGGAQGGGLLLAVSVTDADYIAVAGDGLKAEFTTEALKTLLDEQLEPDFTVKSYDTGIAKFFNAAAEKAEAYCAAHPEMFSATQPGPEGNPESAPEESKGTVDLASKKESGLGPLLWVLLILAVVVFLCVVMFAIRNRGFQRRRSRRTVHRRSSVIRPARNAVTRNDTRPTLQIKAGEHSTGVYRDRRPPR